MLKRLYRYFLRQHVQMPEQYVGILDLKRARSIEEDWGEALLIDRQQELYSKMREQCKTLTTGYTPPDQANGNRIEAHTKKLEEQKPPISPVTALLRRINRK